MRSACFWCTLLDFTSLNEKLKTFSLRWFFQHSMFFSPEILISGFCYAPAHTWLCVFIVDMLMRIRLSACVYHTLQCAHIIIVMGRRGQLLKNSLFFTCAHNVQRGRPVLFSAKILVFRSPYFNDVFHSLITVRTNYVRFVVVLWDYLPVSSNPHHPCTSKCLSSYCCKNQSFRDQQSPTNTTL